MELINKKEFIVTILGIDSETFIIYIAILDTKISNLHLF